MMGSMVGTTRIFFVGVITIYIWNSSVAENLSPPICSAHNVKSRSSNFYDLYGPNNLYHWTEPVEVVSDECFVASVYEHVRVDFPKDMQRSINSNLESYANAARMASQNGASIIVMPEDGIFYSSRGFMRRWEEIVPEPKTLTIVNNNPCVHSAFYQDSPILRRLSCIARENKIYLVANYGTKQPCKKSTNSDKLPDHKEESQVEISDKCPQDNVFQYNTDMIFGPDGTFLSKYRKVNLFLEPFDKAPTKDRVTLETPFGKLGLITCFDMMFKTPAIDLVEDYSVDTILFPTWWFDALPELSAIQFQEAWSSGLNVNLLAANIHVAKRGSIGSGIYSGGEGAQIYIGANNNKSQLMLASIPKKSGRNQSLQQQKLTSSRCRANYEPKMFHIKAKDSKDDNDPYVYSNSPIIDGEDIVFPLGKTSNIITKCVKGFCCKLTYIISSKVNDKAGRYNLSRLVLIVRNGLRPGHFRWWEQICTLATLKEPLSKSAKIEFASDGIISFKHLELTANFDTKYVYPMAACNISKLVPEDQRKMTCHRQIDHNQCKFTYNGNSGSSHPILVASLYGRFYEKDEI